MSPAAMLPADYFELASFLETFTPRLRRYSALLNISQAKMETLAADTAMLRHIAQKAHRLKGEAHYGGIYLDTLHSGSGAWAITETSYRHDAEANDFPAEVETVSESYEYQAARVRTTELVAQIKAHPRYTQELGLVLGLMPYTEQDFVYSSGSDGRKSSNATSMGLKR